MRALRIRELGKPEDLLKEEELEVPIPGPGQVRVAAAAQDACTADFGTHVGSPACPYQWVGATTVLYDGSGNGLGFIGMTSACRGEFGAGARMCESEEIMDSDTLNVNDVPDEGCWVRPSWQPMSAAGGGSPTQRFGLDESGVYDDPGDLTCRGWTRDDSTEEGLVIGVNSIGLSRGAFSQEHCDVQRSIACCKPTPVPAPTSSLSIPIGAAALAGLSMLRGAG